MVAKSFIFALLALGTSALGHNLHGMGMHRRQADTTVTVTATVCAATTTPTSIAVTTREANAEPTGVTEIITITEYVCEASSAFPTTTRAAVADPATTVDAGRNEEIVTVTETVCAAATAATTTTTSSSSQPTGGSGSTARNLQTFTNALGGKRAPAIYRSGERYLVENVNGSFSDIYSARERSCSIQKNLCANAANGGGAYHSVAACESQAGRCYSASISGRFRNRRMAKISRK